MIFKGIVLERREWNHLKKSVNLLCTDAFSFRLTQEDWIFERTFQRSFAVSVGFSLLRYSVTSSVTPIVITVAMLKKKSRVIGHIPFHPANTKNRTGTVTHFISNRLAWPAVLCARVPPRASRPFVGRRILTALPTRLEIEPDHSRICRSTWKGGQSGWRYGNIMCLHFWLSSETHVFTSTINRRWKQPSNTRGGWCWVYSKQAKDVKEEEGVQQSWMQQKAKEVKLVQ